MIGAASVGRNLDGHDQDSNLIKNQSLFFNKIVQDVERTGDRLGLIYFLSQGTALDCSVTAPPYQRISLCQNLKMEELHFSVSSLLHHLVVSTVVVALMVSHWF